MGGVSRTLRTMQTAEVIAALQRRFPPHLAESWDNVGFLLGERTNDVSRLMTCLTLTPDVADEAIEAGVDLIVTHHPILFGGIKRLTSDSPESAAVLRVARSGCGVFSPHTAFDSAAEGINAWLIAQLGAKTAIPLTPTDDDPGLGSGRLGQLAEPATLAEMTRRLCEVTHIDATQVIGDPGREITTIAVACGAAGSMLGEATRAGADLFVTGEMRFHDCLTARTSGVAVLLPGHYATERPAVEVLATQLDAEFADIACFASTVERDPLRWVTASAIAENEPPA